MRYLSRITSPSDLVRLHEDELLELSQEIREFLIEKVSRTGGHLGPNLGVVELTIAIHRIFRYRSPILRAQDPYRTR
jgi:1-deoxy-D-xylulose-5-phosphate synthase